MKTDNHRSDVPYLWPTTLRQPKRPPLLVYLDLNHWIALAKAISRHQEGHIYDEALGVCRNAVLDGRAVFPISDTIYTEIAKIKQHRQRRDLRLAIEYISQYMVITARPVIATHEVEAMPDAVVGPDSDPINDMDYLDWGVARAFGKVGGLHVRNAAGDDITAEARTTHPDGPAAFDALMAAAQLELNRRTIEGPTLDEEPDLRERGWNPDTSFEIAKERAEQEIAQIATFAQYREARVRLRDVVAARAILSDINDILYEGLSRRGATLEKAFPKPEDARKAFDASRASMSRSR